jgi:hypothetical protein
MGLDIECDDVEERVGSYSGVCTQRIDWIKATIQYLEKLKIEMKTESEKIKNVEEAENHKNKLSKLDELLVSLTISISGNSLLNGTFTQNLGVGINFELIEKCRDYLGLFGLTGLVWWVVHSNCERYLSPGQSFDIIETLNKIVKYLDNKYLRKKVSSADTTSADTSQNFYLYPIFKRSVEKKLNVIFC